ncbi:twin-arginine translocation pathway signal protein [Vibrio sp. 10N.286.49.C2]|uniref:DUF1501 domain-containing protein n=1 Tax=unclassified Vibrio TaxID=2614977 RepID=UPI000C84C922|nr:MULTISPECIES: DUF1501 domain-containing protein [unclassified Vibrio]PMH42902.1 twin-arginine translocation pathway signal protein [Vibrio sp. 10N.286.49.C2]PMH53759.1 twin-arginine translocation pathway signal protein [Vibrio sp. 10N.286.49.B1]PMH77767.1 twin-arginine translocation pathway signal protein [Vibrio sp. 10N.286.48.B7]
MKVSRRHFLQTSAASMGVSALSLSSFGALASQGTQCSTDYKALVGIDLAGGNDGYNMLIPSAEDIYPQYHLLRGELALDYEECVALNAEGDTSQLKMHPSLSPLTEAWKAGRLLPIANVGPLVQNGTSNSSEVLPVHLFSHSHQSAMVQTHASTIMSKQGFGALTSNILGDEAHRIDGMSPLFDIGGTQIWTNAIVEQSNSVGVKPPHDLFNDPSGRDRQLFDALHTQENYNNVFERHYATLATESTDLYSEFADILEMETGHPFPETGIGQQLATVFKLIVNRDKFNHGLQYFSCKLGGFDTHSGQSEKQAALLFDLAEALDVFHQAMEAEGLDEHVTSFTHSEFGRTLIPNGTAGTDHGWGSHSFVMGGAVKGSRILGEYPDISEGSDLLLSRGRVIPTTSSDQVHATMMKWLGLRESGISLLFPALDPQAGGVTPQTLDIFRDC